MHAASEQEASVVELLAAVERADLDVAGLWALVCRSPSPPRYSPSMTF